MKTTNRLSVISRLLLIVSALCLAISIFVPIWRIDLNAPQYPEGLRLLIFADKLGGNVDIINGLNHYIGMKTLHTEEFVEFNVLPYIIGFFALFCVVAAAAGKKNVLYALFIIFVLFGLLAMYDFWNWEYQYGHNLNPDAAIIVPGMAYQPPLIGFKQLLNFGAYSIPAIGGWLFVSSGVLMLFSIIYERRTRTNARAVAASLAALFLLTNCAGGDAEPIKLNADNCDFCRMTISDGRFACELLTDKGRVYKFDDMGCMLNYMKENEKSRASRQYVCNYLSAGDLMGVEKAFFIRGGGISSPMGGAIAAFSNPDSAYVYAGRMGAEKADWDAIKREN